MTSRSDLMERAVESIVEDFWVISFGMRAALVIYEYSEFSV